MKHTIAFILGLVFGAIPFIELPWEEAVILNLTITTMIALCTWMWAEGQTNTNSCPLQSSNKEGKRSPPQGDENGKHI